MRTTAGASATGIWARLASSEADPLCRTGTRSLVSAFRPPSCLLVSCCDGGGSADSGRWMRARRAYAGVRPAPLAMSAIFIQRRRRIGPCPETRDRRFPFTATIRQGLSRRSAALNQAFGAARIGLPVALYGSPSPPPASTIKLRPARRVRQPLSQRRQAHGRLLPGEDGGGSPAPDSRHRRP
jgi:hypothetical protein